MHNDVDDLIDSALNSKLLSINLNSQRLDKEKQEVKNVMEQPVERRTRIIESLQNFRVIHKKSSISWKNTSQISPDHAIAPVLPIEEPEYSLSMGYKHLNTTLEMESDEIIKSGVEKLVPIPSECDLPVLEDHSDILSDSNNDHILRDDDAFEDIEYVKASPLDLELVSLEEENDVYQEDEEFDLEDIQDVILREKFLIINRLIANIESLNDTPIPDCILNDHTEETRSGSTTTHANNSLPEYDSFCFEIEPNSGEVISAMINNKDELNEDECFDPRREIDVFKNVEDDD
nr:hypothetical protein [Tanacetum cinerariifolium]